LCKGYYCDCTLQDDNATDYGIDWDAPLASVGDDPEAIEVPNKCNILQDEDYAELKTTIRPGDDDGNYGIDQYITCIQFTERKLLHY